MLDTQLTLDDIIHMTLEAGEDPAVTHAERLLKLIEHIGADLPYDSRIMELSAYLHDWGAFPCFFQKDVPHALRSRQVTEMEILPHLDLLSQEQDVLLEAIELHDYRDLRRTQSNEALLLREADMLEFLSVIGMAREFSWGPKDLEAVYRRTLSRRDGIEGRFTLPRAQEIARVRSVRMDQCLAWLKEESLGVL